MTRSRKWMIGILALIALLFAAYKILPYYYSSKSADAAFFEDEIAAFEEADLKNPPAPGKILFIGSSSIRFWDTLASDMRPLKVLNRGFGGSMLHHSTHYSDRIIKPYKPSAIVLYAGDNDIGNSVYSKSAEQVAGDFDAFVIKVRSDVGDIPIVYIAIKPSTLRAGKWSKMQRANAIIANRAQSDPLLYFADIATPMLDEQGQANDEYLIWDGLHMNAKGYALWTTIIRPILMDISNETEISGGEQADRNG